MGVVLILDVEFNSNTTYTAVAKKIHLLITNPYVNEVTLRRQKPPLK